MVVALHTLETVESSLKRVEAVLRAIAQELKGEEVAASLSDAADYIRSAGTPLGAAMDEFYEVGYQPEFEFIKEDGSWRVLFSEGSSHPLAGDEILGIECFGLF